MFTTFTIGYLHPDQLRLCCVMMSAQEGSAEHAEGKEEKPDAASLGKRKRLPNVNGYWSSTDRFADTLSVLGADDAVYCRTKQQALLNNKYRWIVEISRPEGIMESKKRLAAAVATVDDAYISWRLDIKTNFKARCGWVPWLQVKPGDTNTGYRVYALREFRKRELIGWLYGRKSGEVTSSYTKFDVDMEGTTDYVAGMGLHLMGDPTWGISDQEIIDKVKSLINVKYEKDGAVVASHNICVNEELRGSLG